MAAEDFQVYVSGGPVSLDDWRQAMESRASDLPSLDAAQAEAAQKLGMAPDDYARGVLAEEIGRKRQEEKGRRLGDVIKDFLAGNGEAWKLSLLIRKGVNDVWVARFDGVNRASEVEIPLELADDVVDSGESFTRAKLDHLLRAKLESSAVRWAS